MSVYLALLGEANLQFSSSQRSAIYRAALDAMGDKAGKI